ncbi:MAG: GTPase HflX [Candidatus Nanopelagicales bacterium]
MSEPFPPTDGSLQVEEREALRRVAGLSTELTDISEVEYRQVRLERVVLIGVWTSGTAAQAERSMQELARLAETAGAVVLDALVQRRNTPDAGTYVGSGKARELAELISALDADTLICDGELTPGQLSQLEKVVKVKVVDRTWLILDIFAQHARSREGKTQVELAQLQYMLPRLRGWGEAMSRQAATGGGGIGALRGPGETKLETDRRRIRTQMARLRRQLAAMGRARTVQRAERRRTGTPAAAIVGYTNAGKSSLLNRLTDAGVLVRDELFATLDPTVRRARTPSGREYTLSDTVGFVRHLPHQLVEAFRSTLEEVHQADVLVHVVDGSDPDPLGQLAAVREVLAEIDAGDIPQIIVVNKCEITPPAVLAEVRAQHPDALAVSAATGEGIDELRDRIESRLPRPDVPVRVTVPFERGDLVSEIHEHGEVITSDYSDHGTSIQALVPQRLAARLTPFSDDPAVVNPDED